jgi:hypothetical protein
MRRKDREVTDIDDIEEIFIKYKTEVAVKGKHNDRTARKIQHSEAVYGHG